MKLCYLLIQFVIHVTTDVNNDVSGLVKNYSPKLQVAPLKSHFKTPVWPVLFVLLFNF